MIDTSPSALAATALGLTPKGIAWGDDQGELVCALERRRLQYGELVVPFRPSPSFMDDTEIARTGIVSASANLFLAKDVMMVAQRAVFCAEGAFSLATDAARTWFFLTPPRPPFVAVIADSMLQHLVWRTPICCSQDLITFRHGAKLHSVRRRRLIDAVAQLKEYGRAAFVALDREGKHPGHGVLRRDCTGEMAQALADLTPGELIALATLAKKTPVEPVRPQAFVYTTRQHKEQP
ncbi:MAG: hypothetical protein COS34_03435 [Lysobacterales bacterium CG02_land_8_20_14_3_00_62_12]|nr:MAG: hypothetical protein COS34_03435 [Xanthomonadales bacterium CG02_land_8_20_14_3_00_62_12]